MDVYISTGSPVGAPMLWGLEFNNANRVKTLLGDLSSPRWIRKVDRLLHTIQYRVPEIHRRCK
jgi:hypothetical protein